MIDFFSAIGSAIMWPLYYLVSAVMVAWHWVFEKIGMDINGGAIWALSIIGLTVVIRTALIPLFVKQIKSTRNAALLQPKIREIQKKYGADRERVTQETMALYKEAGTNPFASCMPLLVQMPIFLALFRLIQSAASNGTGHGFLTDEMAARLQDAKLWGQVPLADTFVNSDGAVVKLTAAVLVLAMFATTFMTQKQLMSKNMPPEALTGQYAQMQKMMLYVMPVVMAFGGIAFPIGVLIYWTTSNLWTMGQQFYVIRNNPAPNTPAMVAKERRDKAKQARREGITLEQMELREQAEVEAKREEQLKEAPRVQRQKQPKSARSNNKKKK